MATCPAVGLVYFVSMTGIANTVQVGDFLFDPATGELSRDGSIERLRPQVARALSVLVERAGAMVSREDLHTAIWPDTRVEYDLSLNVCIRQLRMALGDTAESSTYIETLPRRGYRLLATVTRPGSPRTRPPHRSRLRAGFAVVVSIGVAVLIVRSTYAET